MKIIKYKLLSEDADGDTPLLSKELFCPTATIFEENLRIAQEEAHNGEYTIEDDGEPEPEPEATLETRVGTLESDSTEMKEALEMILSGVTE